MNIEELIKAWEDEGVNKRDWRLRLRNTILFIKDENNMSVNTLASNLGVSYRTIYRMMEDSEYTPNLTLKGFLYIQDAIGYENLKRMK